MFSSMFFPFSCHFKSLFFGWPVRSAESDFSLSAKRFFIWLGLTEQEARICTQKRPNFYFSGRWLGMVVLFLIFSFAADFSFCYLFDACDVLGVAI